MKLTIPTVEIRNDEGFSSEVDIFSRKGFGERLANLVEKSQGNLVIALDAKWGEGKSTFIKMWRGYIEYKREDKLISIYFDAFANDYQKDPFLALASEIYELIKDESDEKKEDFKRKAGNAVKSMARGAIKIGVRTVSGGMLDGSIIDSSEKDISKLLSDQIDGIIADRLQNTIKDKLAISQFRDYLEKFAEEEGNSIVFIIDELDRCRPDFALDLIEQIKHIFSVKGITFLLVLNRNQLQEAIKSRYGSGVEATVYLQKFINLWLSLPRKSGHHQDHGALYIRHAFNLMLNEGEDIVNTDAIELLSDLVKMLKPSFREIEQILSYFSLIHNMMNTNQSYNSSFQFIFTFICYIKVSKPNLINRIENESIDSLTLIEEIGISIKHNDLEYNYINYLLKLITFDLASEEDKTKMIEEQQITFNGYGRTPNNIMRTVCSWLAEISINH